MKQLLAVILVLLLAPAAYAADADWDKTVAAAQREGRVVIYTALGGPFQDAALKAFEQKYGIAVDAFQGRASEVRERVRAEQAAGRFLGDVYQGSDVSILQVAQEGQIVPHGGVPATARLLPDFPATDLGVPIALYPYAILVNTNLVKPEDEPKSWKDLLDPRWKGRILSDDLRVFGAPQVMFETTYNAFGRAFHEGLAAQNLTFTRAPRDAERRVARGEYPIYLPDQLPFALALKGLPVKFVVPEEGAVYTFSELALLQQAPHPDAARLLMDFLLSDEIQLAFANAGLRPVVAGIAERTTGEIRKYMDAKLLGTYTLAGQDRMPRIAGEIYK